MVHIFGCVVHFATTVRDDRVTGRNNVRLAPKRGVLVDLGEHIKEPGSGFGVANEVIALFVINEFFIP